MKRFLPLFLIASPLWAETAPRDPDIASVPALIEQLASPKVRLRDEAQSLLTDMPEAEAGLRAALAATPSAEARLRLTRILKDLRDQAWMLRWESAIEPGAQEDAVLRELAVSPDGTLIAAANLNGVDLFDAGTGNFLRRVGNPSDYANEPGGVRRSLAFSPDGTLVASTDNSCQIYIDRTDGTRLAVVPGETIKRMMSVRSQAAPGSSTVTVTQREVSMAVEPWGIVFLEGGKRLVVYSQAGLTVHHLEGGERKLIPLEEIFVPEGFQIAPRGIGISADRQTIGLGIETMGSKDRAALVRVSDFTVTANWKLPAIPCCIAVNRDGTEALVGLREGGVVRCTPGEEAAVPVHRIGGWVAGLDYAPDEKSAILSSSLATVPLRLIALPSGDALWSARPSALGYEDAAFMGPDRIFVTGHDNRLRSWNRRIPGSAKATPP